MGIGDKLENTKDKLVGGAKEHLGDATDNERLQAEGLGQQAEGRMGEHVEKAKDAAHDAADRARDAFDNRA